MGPEGQAHAVLIEQLLSPPSTCPPPTHLSVIDRPQSFIGVFMGPEGQVHTILIEQVLQPRQVQCWDTGPDLKSVIVEFIIISTGTAAYCLP